jgi:hypothetical protein
MIYEVQLTNTTTFDFNAGDSAPFNEKAISTSEELCHVCGRKVGKNPLWFEVVNGGDLRLQDGTEAIRDAGYMGHYPVGSECAKKFAPNLLKRLGA